MPRRNDISKILIINLGLLSLAVSLAADVHVFEPKKVRSVCGIVVLGGTPIEGATVVLQSEKQDRTVAETETSKNGRYQFQSVPKGKYWLQIKSSVGTGAVFVWLKKSSDSECKELIETNIHPGQLPDDENNSIRKLSNSKN